MQFGSKLAHSRQDRLLQNRTARPLMPATSGSAIGTPQISATFKRNNRIVCRLDNLDPARKLK